MTTLTDDELLAWLDVTSHQAKKENMDMTASISAQIAARFRELLALQEWQPRRPLPPPPKDG